MKKIILSAVILLCGLGAFAYDNLITASPDNLEKTLVKTGSTEFSVKLASDGTWVIEYNDTFGKKAGDAAKSAFEKAKEFGLKAIESFSNKDKD